MAVEKTKVIVTGGAGFIGSHLAEGLIKNGYDTHIIDIKKGSVPEGVSFHEADIRDFLKIAPLFRGAKFVFHTAALPRVQPSILDPRLTHDINVNGTLNVLVASRDAGVSRLVYSASSSAYGNQETLPLREDMEPRPLSPYALQKYIGEEYCKLFSKIYEIETVSLRYFNVYGEGAPSDGPYALVVSRFLDLRAKGESMTIVPDGNQSRDFTHVRDVVAANILASTSFNVGKGEVINIGGGKNYSVLNVADLIGGPRVFVEPRIEPLHTLADISKAKKLISWEPKIKFEEGIAALKKLYHLE